MKQTITLPLELVNMEDKGFHLLIRLEQPNGNNGFWIIDTGASKTVVNIKHHNLYEELNDDDNAYETAGINGAIKGASIGNLHSLTFGSIELKNITVALIELEHINIIYEKSTNYSIIGLIGSDVLMQLNAIIDYSKLELRIAPIAKL